MNISEDWKLSGWSPIEIQSSVVMEASASALPVVTVRASSMPEFVIDGDNGYIVPPDDVDLMSKRIITLVKDRRKSRKMGQAGRMIAEAHSNQRFLEEHEGLYEAVLKNLEIYHQEGILA